mmetsp:Transcript_16709/g.57005  ORF Transcript_16709/g.57005 Transcript_16709/m.57005 type:complete len:306 (+) Transcript_16709:1114-2031(+)
MVPPKYFFCFLNFFHTLTPMRDESDFPLFLHASTSSSAKSSSLSSRGASGSGSADRGRFSAGDTPPPFRLLRCTFALLPLAPGALSPGGASCPPCRRAPVETCSPARLLSSLLRLPLYAAAALSLAILNSSSVDCSRLTFSYASSPKSCLYAVLILFAAAEKLCTPPNFFLGSYPSSRETWLQHHWPSASSSELAPPHLATSSYRSSTANMSGTGCSSYSVSWNPNLLNVAHSGCTPSSTRQRHSSARSLARLRLRSIFAFAFSHSSSCASLPLTMEKSSKKMTSTSPPLHLAWYATARHHLRCM